jgi:hypothetical protein
MGCNRPRYPSDHKLTRLRPDTEQGLRVRLSDQRIGPVRPSQSRADDALSYASSLEGVDGTDCSRAAARIENTPPNVTIDRAVAPVYPIQRSVNADATWGRAHGRLRALHRVWCVGLDSRPEAENLTAIIDFKDSPAERFPAARIKADQFHTKSLVPVASVSPSKKALELAWRADSRQVTLDSFRHSAGRYRVDRVASAAPCRVL